MIDDYSWDAEFSRLFGRCLDCYRSGNRDWDTYYSAEDLALLDSVGYRPREFFDFVEDFAQFGDPSPTTAVLIAAVRRDYFRTIQKGRPSETIVRPGDLPPKSAELQGIAGLPRVLAKARAKLRGEMDPDIMFGCGFDRAFFQSHRLHPADFLRLAWAAGDDDEAVARFLLSRSPAFA